MSGIAKISDHSAFETWCSTADEYRKTVGKDAALERRFQPVTIEEPSVENTISILRGLKPKYEVHHGTEISDAALVTGECCRSQRPRGLFELDHPDWGIRQR